MGRLNDSWFEFNGVKSNDMGVRIMSAHMFSRGKMRGTQETVSARDGYLWISDDSMKQYDAKYTCRVLQSNLRACAAWLHGNGMLRFSQEPDAQYSARPIKAIEFKRITLDADPLYKFTVTFTCQPYAYVYPAAEDITITTSGTGFTALGTYFALPKLAIYGSGAFSVTISGGGHSSSMFFTGVPSGGIVVDSELMDALTMDGAGLLNRCIRSGSDDFFRIWPGANTLTWGLGSGDEEESGGITKIVLTPRWRWL